MKGYVSVTFTDKQKQELLALNEVLHTFYVKPSYRMVTKTVGIWFWKREEVVYERIEKELPESMAPFFYKIELDSYTTYRPNTTSEAVSDLASLVKQSKTIIISSDLAGVLNWLIEAGYLSTDNTSI